MHPDNEVTFNGTRDTRLNLRYTREEHFLIFHHSIIISFYLSSIFSQWGAPLGTLIRIPTILIHSWKLLVARSVHVKQVRLWCNHLYALKMQVRHTFLAYYTLSGRSRSNQVSVPVKSDPHCLLHFSPPGEQLTQPGRPWRHH